MFGDERSGCFYGHDRSFKGKKSLEWVQGGPLLVITVMELKWVTGVMTLPLCISI